MTLLGNNIDNNNNSQKSLNDDIKRVNVTGKVLVQVDKSKNIYELDKKDYKKYLRKNMTKTYKRINKKGLNAVNEQAIKNPKKLNIDKELKKIQETEAYLTIKHIFLIIHHQTH